MTIRNWFRCTYGSAASLHDVASVCLFRDRARGICRGLLFTYKNGCMRALGECCHNRDEIVRPAAICHRAKKLIFRNRGPAHAIEVLAARVEPHVHEGVGWTCHAVGKGAL